MGSWTGLPPIVGAPLSGALWGAGLGAAYGGIKSLLSDDDPYAGPTPWYKTPWILGALAGTGIGLYAGADKMPPGQEKQHSVKQASYLYDRNSVLRAVLFDNNLLPAQKNQAAELIERAPDSSIRRLVEALGVGGLTGLAVYKLLGSGLIPSLVLGGLAARLYDSHTKPKAYI
jgi:hypothetical protein